MKFTEAVFIVSLFSTGAWAAGSDVHFECPAAPRNDPGLRKCQADARYLKSLELKGCNIPACIAGAGAAATACTAAAVMDFLNPTLDLTCIAAIGTASAGCEDCG